MLLEEKQYVILLKEDFTRLYEKSAAIAAKVALEKLEQEQKKVHENGVDKRLHNTKLLLRNYRMLRTCVDHSIYSSAQIKESAADILRHMMYAQDDGVIVDSIKRNVSRTTVMVAHIDQMLRSYETYCKKSPTILDARRYQVLYDMYIAEIPKTAIQIAKEQNMSKENVYLDIKIATERVSALIFGIDGLKVI